MIAGFAYKTSDECVKSNESTSFCPMKTADGKTCVRTGLNLDQLHAYNNVIDRIVPLVKDDQYFYDWERFLLSTPPMQDTREAPNLTLSRLTPLGKAGNEVSCKPGEEVKIRADLVDGWGKPRTQGYDDVRGWMVEQNGAGRRAAAHVVDLKNGSYELSFRCLWPGTKSKVKL